MLSRRVQILVDPVRYQRLEEVAAARGTSVAETIRRALEIVYPDDAQDRRRAAAAIIDAPLIDLGDVAALRAEIAGARDGTSVLT